MSIRMVTIAAAWAFVFISMQGCSSDDTPAAETSTMPAPGQSATDAVTMEGLAGSWTRACTASSSTVTYSTAQLTVADNVAVLSESFFTDNACTTAASPSVIVTDNSLVFDGEFTSTTLGNANNVESTIESKTVDGNTDSNGINEVTHDIMLITNNTLYFGNKADANNGTTVALRPETLDETNTWSPLE